MRFRLIIFDCDGVLILQTNEIYDEALMSTVRLFRPQFPLLLPGGRYDATYEASFGDRTIEAIQKFTPNVTIIGVSGLLFEKGVFCHGAEEVRVKQLLWTIPTDTRLIAVDWSKIGRRDAHAFGHSVEELKLGARKAVVVTNKPPRNAPSDERKEFDQQVRLMQEAMINVDVLDVPEGANGSGNIL